jgi:biofilm PGA synthesis N-glycosyltransferase PgaC
MLEKYLIITPCRNEAEYIEKTIASVADQTIRPEKWIIVDDGSTDETWSIITDAAKKYSFIRVIHGKDRGFRYLGAGVVEAFYAGLNEIDLDDYEYFCKLDADVVLPRRYFEDIMKRMEANPRMGTCSGKPYHLDFKTGRLVSEKCGDEMSVGMAKFYRTRCFQQIGGFIYSVMWDGIDCHRCRMLGWVACSWDDPEIRFTHLRPMGSSFRGILTGRTRHGRGQYFMGTSLLYMVISAFYRMTRPPLIVGGLAMLWGYITGIFARIPRYKDLCFRRFLRCYQWKCLLLGKKKATAWTNKARAKYWNPG